MRSSGWCWELKHEKKAKKNHRPSILSQTTTNHWVSLRQILNSTSVKLKWCQLTSLCGAKCSLYQEWWPFAILQRFSCNKVKRQDLFPSDRVDFSLLGALWTHLSWEFSALPALRGEHLIAFLDILFRCTLSYIKCCSHAAVMANSTLSALAFLNFSLGYSQNASFLPSSPSFPPHPSSSEKDSPKAA